MVEDFLTYIEQQNLWDPSKDKILLAVSGGIDSIALVYLCHLTKINFSIAHCNFQLRGKASDQDALFVRQLAEQLDVSYYEQSFDTIAIIQQQKKSIQVIARELRYSWLEEIRNTHQYAAIAVGHHLNDSVETVLMNLTTGCGIKGLHGILPKQGHIVRPLLFTTKKAIHKFGKKMSIRYREDASNQSTKYTRNLIRHKVIPTLQKINPSLEQTMQHNLTRFREIEKLYQLAIAQLKEKAFDPNQSTINIKVVIQSPAPQSLLYEILAPFGFHVKQIVAILAQYQQDSGAIYTSTTHQLLKDRVYWYLRSITPKQDKIANDIIVIKEFPSSIKLDEQRDLNFELSSEGEKFDTEKKQTNSLYLDYHQLVLPLHIRSRKDGDRFLPLGMNGKHKKIAKYLKDQKINQFDKAQIRLLCDANDQILWVIGKRASEIGQITSDTINILKIELQSTL